MNEYELDATGKPSKEMIVEPRDKAWEQGKALLQIELGHIAFLRKGNE